MYHASNVNGKRPSSLAGTNGGNTRKKARKEDDDDSLSPAAEKDEPKAKSTRGSRYVIDASKLTMVRLTHIYAELAQFVAVSR